MKQEIEAALQQELNPSVLEVVLEGNHCSIQIVSEVFTGLSKVKRQQKVYACLSEKIASGEIHAVNISAASPDEA